MPNTLAGLDKVILKSLSAKDSTRSFSKSDGAKVDFSAQKGNKKDDTVSFSGQLDKKIHSKSQKTKDGKQKDAEPVAVQEVIAHMQKISISPDKLETIAANAESQNVEPELLSKVDAVAGNPIALSQVAEKANSEFGARVDLEVEGFKESVDTVKASKESLDNIIQEKTVATGEKSVVQNDTKALEQLQKPNKSKANQLSKGLKEQQVVSSQETKQSVSKVADTPHHIEKIISGGKVRELKNATVSPDSRLNENIASGQAKVESSFGQVAIKSISENVKIKSGSAKHKDLEVSEVVVPQNQEISNTSVASNASVDETIAVRDVARQVIDDIKVNFTPDTKSMTIALDPPELGKINIRMVQDNEGLSGVMQVQSSEVRDHIQRELPQVIATLHNSGIDVKKVEVVLANDNNNSAFESDFTSGSMEQDSGNTQTQEGQSFESNATDLVAAQAELEFVNDDSINVYV